MPKEKVSFEELLGLTPPRAPIIGEKSVERNIREGVEPVIESQGDVRHLRAVENQSSNDSKPIIVDDLNLNEMFEWCAQNSSFRRWLIEFVKKVVPGFEGKYHRFSKEEMNKAFMQKRKEVEHKLKSFDKNARNYQNVMAEFKEKLEKLK